MKIRLGFVSNSSATSFTVPAFLLTDEQKEMLLSIDEMKETKAQLQEKLGTLSDEHTWENSKNDYPRNEEYHRIYKEMIENGEWEDLDWETSENKKRQEISGSTGMWNGTIGIFMEKIGIDPTMIEIINHGHGMVHMATHPEAVQYHIERHHKRLEEWAKETEEDKQRHIEFGMRPYSVCPYALSDEEMRDWGDGSFIYEHEPEDDYQETYSFVKRKKKKSED